MAKISGDIALTNYVFSSPFQIRNATKNADNNYSIYSTGWATFNLGAISTNMSIFKIKFNQATSVNNMRLVLERVRGDIRQGFIIPISNLTFACQYTFLINPVTGYMAIFEDNKCIEATEIGAFYTANNGSADSWANKWTVSFEFAGTVIIDSFSYAVNVPNDTVILYQSRLQLKDNKVYGMKNGTFTKFTDDWIQLTNAEKKEMFLSTNYETASIDDLKNLGQFNVLTYTDTKDKTTVELAAVPKDQLILPRFLIDLSSYEDIAKAMLTAVSSGDAFHKVIVTTNLKTYQTFKNDMWQNIDHTDLAAVKANGIDAAALQNIDRAAWDKLLKGKSGIGFAYLMGIDAITDQCAIDQITLQANMKGTWK